MSELKWQHGRRKKKNINKKKYKKRVGLVHVKVHFRIYTEISDMKHVAIAVF